MCSSMAQLQYMIFATVLGLSALLMANEVLNSRQEAAASRHRLLLIEQELAELAKHLSYPANGRAGTLAKWIDFTKLQKDIDMLKDDVVSILAVITPLRTKADHMENQITELRKYFAVKSENDRMRITPKWYNLTHLQKDIQKLKQDTEPIWGAIRLLEHGVQKANHDFTPFWPMPPKECTKFRRQREIRTLGNQIREQMLYGPMQKMALIADKVRVHDIVHSFKCPNLHFIPILGVWDANNITSIDLTELPSSYALKANHGAGFVVIVVENIVKIVSTFHSSPEVSKMNSLRGKPVQRDVVIKYFQYAFRKMYRDCAEPHYAFIDKLVLAESLISTKEGDIPMDYKIFSTKGRFIFAKLFLGRFEDMKQGFVDRNFTVLEGYRARKSKKMATEAEIESIRPKRWDHMVEIAECLTFNMYRWGGIRMARVDLYDWEDKITFGELTLTPAGGNPSVLEKEHEIELGAQFDI